MRGPHWQNGGSHRSTNNRRPPDIDARPAPPHQLVEQRPAGRPWMHDLAVQDGAPAGELLANGLRQRFECLERIPIAGHQPAGAALDISDRSKAIQFRLEDPVRMLKGRVEARQRHRSDAGEAHVTLV